MENDMKRLMRIVLASMAVLLATACSSPVKLDEGNAKIEDRSSGSGMTAPRTGPSSSGVATVSADNMNLPGADGAPQKRSIFFDFDSYVLRDDAKPVIEAHAKFLLGRRDAKVVLEGNTDERGGREYNLALGQKRAEAVKRALSLLGVSESQLEAVSFGKEKPRATGSDEAAWAQNRRTDISYR
jgi:peptidoglycan-associated lipoprotein